MNTLSMETFLVVVRSQSLSRAAEELHIAQTTVSQRLKVLERELGIVLIERGKGIKQIRLTPSGEEFYKLAEQWSFIQRGMEVLQSQGPKLELVVGAVDSINTFILPPIYSALNKHQPPIKLTIRTLHSPEIYEEIEERQIDVGFATRERVHPNVMVTKCFTSPMVVLRRTNTKELNLNTIHPSELDPNQELLMPWGQEYQSWHDYWWDPLSTSTIKLDSTHLLLSLLKEPNQWAIVPKWIANKVSKSGTHSIFQLSDSPPHYTCYRLEHKQPTKLTQQALDILDHYFQLSFPEPIDD